MGSLTFEEARMMANVNQRSKRLKQDGYGAKRIDVKTVEVSNGQGETYTIDEIRQSCTCPFYCKWNGKHPCKHLLGYRALLDHNQQEVERRISFPLARCTGVELNLPGSRFPLGTLWTTPKAWRAVGVSNSRLTDLIRHHGLRDRGGREQDIVGSRFSVQGYSIQLTTEIPQKRTILALGEEA